MKLGVSQSLVQSDATNFYFLVQGGAQEPQTGFLDGVDGGRRRRLAFFNEVLLGGAAVTVPRQGRRGADADPHGLSWGGSCSWTRLLTCPLLCTSGC